MTWLVLGGSGFVGKHLLATLNAADTEVISVSRTALHVPKVMRCVRGIVADLFREDAVGRILRETQPTVIVNLVALKQGDAGLLCSANVSLPVGVLGMTLRWAPHARLVFVGSAAEYGLAGNTEPMLTENSPCQPSGMYGLTKLAGTVASLSLARQLGLCLSVLRPFNIIGAGSPRELVVGAIIERIIASRAQGERQPISVGRVDSIRDFVAVEDVVSAIVSLARHDLSPAVYNVCSGEPRSIEEVVGILLDISGGGEWRTDPALVRPDDVPVAYGSYAKLAHAVGFAPRVSLRDSLASAWRAAVNTDVVIK
jgi:nucleoside-diphosphate-sugar epimerase